MKDFLVLVLKNVGSNICVLILALYLAVWANPYIFWYPVFTHTKYETRNQTHCYRSIVINKGIIHIRWLKSAYHIAVFIKY